MSLSTWLRKLAAGTPRKTIRHTHRADGSPRTRLKMYLELLEDRLAPAVLHWTGAALDTTAFVPGGLSGNYYDALSGAGPGVTLVPTNVNSLFQVTATATAVTPYIDFPDITAKGFTERGGTTSLFTPASPNNDGALFLGEIYLSHLGKYTFATASDDGSNIWLDATSNVDLTGAVKVVSNDFSQGRTLRSGTYTNTSIGLHTIAIGYFNGGGGSNMTAFWDPTGGTITDNTQFVIPSSVLYNSAPASKFSNVGNWLEAAVPANGDTIVFDSSTAGFKASTPAINDLGSTLAPLSLNTITVNNGAATPAPITMAGNAIIITNSISNFSLGVAGTSDGPTTTIGFDKVTLGANTVITNTSAAPLSTSPTLQISSPIDLAGKTLTSGTGGTSDTGLTVISGVISSSVPGTDHVIENGGGFLALTGTNTFDTAAQVTQGILVDAGTQSLGAVGAIVSGPTAFLGISQGDGGTYSTGVTLATGASIIKVDNSSPTVSFPIILTGNATIADGVGANRSTGNPNFNGTINLGTHTLTIDINAGAGVTGAATPAMFFNGAITGLAGSAVTKIGVGRAKLTVDNPALVAAINVNTGFLSVASNKALGAGANVVTVASGASLAFEGAITTPAAQGVTVSGTGVGGHGALFSWGGNNTFAGPITVATGDLYVGGTGGNTVLSAPINLGPANLVLVGTGGNNITITGAITGAAGTTITKSDTGTDTIATNNKATFLGTTSITAGVLNITADGALGNGAITEAGGSLGLSGGITYTGPLSLSGAGALGAGSVESLNGTNTITGAITQSAAGSLGAASGATLVLPNAINNSTFDLTLTGRGTTNVGGVISGSGGLIKGGTGTATLNAVMAYTGPTTVNGGVLVLGNPNAISAGGNVTVNGGSIGLPDGTTLPASKLVTLNGGAIEALTGNVNSTIAGNVKLTANSFLKSDAGTLTVNGNVDLNGFTLTGEGAGNIVVNGIISGNVTNTPIAGLQGSYYATSELPNGTNDNLLDPNSAGYIGNLVPTSKDIAAQINFTDVAATGFAPDFPAIKGNNVAAHFVGSVLIDAAGPIQFESGSDDGSVVFIDGNRVVNNPGGHGAPGPSPFGTATLSAGLHSIEVIYYQGGGGASLVLSWDPTNKNTYVVVPADHLFTASTNSVDKLGSGTMTLNGANTYVGGTNISAGILVAGNATALNPSGAPVNINGGALGLPAAGGVTLPANQVLNLNGGTIENLGGVNTIASPLSLSIPSSIVSDAGTLTLNGNIQQNVSNLTFAGAGNTVVNGIITSLAGAPGLLESQLNANIDTTSATGSPKYGFDIQLTTTMAEVLGGDGPVLATALHKWGTNNEWIYQGQMFWPNYNNTGMGYISFAKDIDDDTSIKVDGVSYLFSTSWNTDLGTGIIALPTGYHNVDFRFSNGGGGAGANATNSNGWTGFTNTKGFVYRVDAGPNDPLGTKTGTDVSVNYAIPTDPGDGSLFRQQAPSVIQNGTGTTTFNAANTYAGETVVTAGTLVAGNVNALGSGDGTFGTGTSVTGGSLALQGNITFPSTEKLTLAGSGANGAGALENLSGNNIVNQVIDLPGNATIGSTAGTLTLNGNITSTAGSPNLSFTGAGNTTVNGQIIGGTQILNVTGNYYSGLTTGSGSGLLDPNSTNWIGNYTPQTTAPLVTSIQYADLSNGGTGFIPYTTLKGSNIGALWTGTINITQSTPISFLTGSDDGSRMWIDGTGQFNTTGATLVVDNNRDQGLTFRSGGPQTLTPGLHTIAIAWYNGGGGANMFADWDLSGLTPSSYVSGATSGTAIPYALPGVVNVSKTGSGTVTLAAASNSYSGSTTIDGGVLQANGDVSLGSIAKAPISIGAGTLEIMSGASYSSTHPYALTDPTSTILVDGAAETITIPGVVSGPGNLNKTGPGGIVLGGSNPYTGGTTDKNGTITVTNAGGLGSGTITMAGGLLALNVANPAREAALASATGWTKDVIWANSEASPISGTNSGLDIPGPASGGYVFYEQGSLFAPSNTGLPHNGVITSATSGISYQLQPYTASNDLRLPGPGTTGTLTLAAASPSNPNVFKSLSFLDLAANGGDATYSATINFVDGGAATVFTGLVAPDMAGNTPAAITNLGRIKTNGSASYDTAGHGQMFDQTITLAAADSVRVVKSISFAQTGSTTTNPAKLQIMAVSGLENFTSLGLSNNVVVTADSTIDVQTNAATLGALSVGTNKLTVTGTVPVTLGATTLTGNPTLSPATGQTVTLGAVGGAGFLNTTGPGTTNVGTIGTGVTLGGSGTFANLVTVGAGGAVNPGSAAGLIGLLTPSGGITFQAGSSNNVEIGGTAAGTYDQISSGGTITLGNAALNVSLVNGFTPGPGDKYTIIKNTGGNAIVGTFLGLPEGSGVSVSGKALQISYVGGSGHDVVLTSKVAGPATQLSASASQTLVNAGVPLSILVQASDAGGLPAAAFTDVLHFTSTDPTATLPADGTISNSSGSFNVTFHQAGSQTVTVTDKTNGSVTSATTAAVTVSPALANPTANFLVTGPSSSAPGGTVTVTVASRDANNNSTGAGYTGKVHITSSDSADIMPAADATLTNGVGTFTVTFSSTPGLHTLTASDSASAGITGSTAVSVGTVTNVPGASVLTVVPSTTTPATNTGFDVTVTALDKQNAVVTTYTDAVTLTSSDPLAKSLGSHTFVAADQGKFVFHNVKLKTNGSQTITALDTVSTNPIVTGSTVVNAAGLTAVIAKTPTGFTATFNQAINAKDLTIVGAAGTTADVTFTGAAAGALPGTLVVNATGTVATFNVTGNFLVASSPSGTAALPDDTYTVTLISGVGANGFQDVNGLGLDNGSGGHADVTSTITTTYQGSAMLGIADFARGPNAAADTTTIVKVPNKTGVGIPITLYKAAGVTGGSFTLTYNSQILTVTGGIGKLTMTTNVPSADGIHSVATFTFTGLTPSSGAQVIGNVTAYVPNSAKTQYQVKDLLSLGNITVTGSAATVLAGAGVDINAYLADVNGDHHIDALDKGLLANVASTSSTGFAAFTLMDPAIIADLANDNLVTSNSVSLINNYLLGKPVGEIPALAGIPDAQFVSPFAFDPIVSLPAAVASSGNGVVSVPVLLDHPRPEGSTGLVEAELALTYDPSVLSLSASDITLGTIPGQGTGWELTSVVDAATGQIGIQLFSLTAITSAQAGSLVNITFHVLSGAEVPATAVQLVDAVTPHGQSFGTVLADAQAAMILTPGISRLEVMTGMAPSLVVAPVSSSQVTATTVSGQITVDGLVPNGSRYGAEVTYLPISTELEEAAPLAVLSNGSVVGETATAHAVPAGLVVTGALAFQTTAIAATQLAGQTFQIGSTGWLSTMLASNILASNPQQLAEQLFLALGRSMDAPVDLSTLSAESLNSLTWEAAPQATWLAAPAQGNAADTQTDSQAQQGAAIADRIATVDRIFADLANESDAFGDFGDN